MAVRNYTANWKTRDVFESITPNVKIANDYDIAPVGEYKPAPWLPVVWSETAEQSAKDAFVISSGKVVAMDREGYIVPAGLRVKMQTVNLTYTSTDVTHGVIDLTTGEKVTAAVAYTPLQVAQALVERGLVLEGDVAAVTAANVIPAFISRPVGINAYNVYVWAGEEGETHFHNYRKQHMIQFLRQTQLIVPHQASASLTNDDFVCAALDAAPTSFAAGTFVDAGELWEIADIRQLDRYSFLSATAPVVALGLAQQPVAKNTDRTPFTCDVDDVLVTEKTSADAVKRAGDYFIDAAVGVLFLHSDTWATQVTAAATLTFSYHYYSTGTASTEKFVYIDGTPKHGDYLTYDVDSNLVPISPSTVANVLDIVGRVHKVVSQPKGLLDKVKTAWSHSTAAAKDKMPGTATEGYTDLITLMDEAVADEVVICFIDVR